MRKRVQMVSLLSAALIAATVAICVLQRDIEPQIGHREVAVDIYGQDLQMGRIMLGGTVESDLRLAGQALAAATER